MAHFEVPIDKQFYNGKGAIVPADFNVIAVPGKIIGRFTPDSSQILSSETIIQKNLLVIAEKGCANKKNCINEIKNKYSRFIAITLAS